MTQTKKKITVYHGTTSDFNGKIGEEGLVSRRSDNYVYVTTDKKVARKYAWAWTGGRLHEAKELNNPDVYLYVGDEGMIAVIEIEEDRLEIDDYNLEAEPDQYKVLGGIEPDCIKDLEYIEFPEFENKENILFAKCFLIGVMRE